MKWFKHDSDANTDAKLRRLRMKYGMEGYGLYWYCLELIAKEVTNKKITFELEHDAEVIAYDCRISAPLVEDMMTFMVEIGLFQNSEGRVFCLRMATRMEENLAKSPIARELKAKAAEFIGNLPVDYRCNNGGVPVRNRPEVEVEVEVEVDKKKRVGAKRFAPPTRQEVEDYMLEKKADFDQARSWSEDFINHYEANGWVVGKTKMKSWKHAASRWTKQNLEKQSNGNRQGQNSGKYSPDPLSIEF